MSLFPSTLTGRVLDDGVTEPPVIELQGISAGQLATVLTQYTPLETTTANTAAIGTNAAAIAALQGQVSALPAAPDLTPYALAADLATAEGLIAANASGLTAVNTSLTLGLASKANQSALDALQVQVDGKSTPASVDLKLANHPTIAAMNSSIASTNNATLATVATTYALKSVVDQLAIDLAARQTAADVDQRVATALLSFLTQTAYQAGQALQDARFDGHDADILALQNAGPYATGAELAALQVSLQSAIDGILAEIATLGGATNLVNAPAWVGEITWDLLVGTNQIRNLHAVAPLSIALANDNWTLSLSCDAYSTAQTDALLLPKASESWVLATLGGYYTTQQADDAIAAALTNHFTRAEVTANLVAFLGQANTYTDDQLLSYSDTATTNQLIADALLTVTLSNGQTWNGGPTFNLLRGTQVLRNLSVAGALTATFQNLDDTILIESDSYARGETYTQQETGAAITAAIDALNLSQYRTEAQVLALIAGELVPYWDQAEVSSFVAGELANYQTGSQVSSAISSALSSYDDSSQVDSKIVTALLDFYTRAETDQAIADAATGGVDLSPYFTSAETQTYVANELLAYYPRTELDSQLTATFTQYWTSGRTQTEIDDAVAGLLDQATADARYFVRAPGAESGNIFNLVQEQFTPRIVRNLLLEAPLQGDAILGNQSTLRLRCDSWTKAEADARFLRTSDLGPLDARYFPNTPGAEGGGIFNLVQTQFTPVVIRNLLCQTPLLLPTHPGQRQHAPNQLRLLVQGPIGRAVPPHRQLQLPGPAGHRPGERPRSGSHGRPDGQQPHGHQLPADAPAAERRRGPADPERHHHHPRRRRHPAGQLHDRQHRPGAGRHRPLGPDAQRHHGGFRPVLRGLHGGHRGLHEQQLHHRHAADRERPAGAGTAGAQRPGGTAAHDPGGYQRGPGGRHPTHQRGHSARSLAALPEPVGRQQRGAGAEPAAGADRRGAQRLRGPGGAQRRGHGRRVADPGQQRAERAGGAQGARRRRGADEHSLPVHELQHHQRHRQPGDRTEHRREQQRGADLRLRLREPLGQGTQNERPGPLGEGAPGDLRCRGAPDVRPHRGGQGPDRLHRPGGAGHPSGREGV